MLKFNRYHVTDGQIKAKVSYSINGRIDGRECVTLYAKDYDSRLGKLFSTEYQNESDLMTDYFDKGHVTLFKDHPLYTVALQKAKEIKEILDAKYLK